MSEMLHISNRISADNARRMAPSIKIAALESELKEIYNAVKNAIVHGKNAIDIVSPSHFDTNHVLVNEVETELKKDGYDIRITERSNHAIYHLKW